MKKSLITLLLSIMATTLFAADETITLMGRVQESAWKTDLTKAIVLLYDTDGNVTDSIKANQGLNYRAGVIDTTSMFFFSVPRVDSTFVFDVVCDGYNPRTVTFMLDNIKKSERWREIPTIYLDRAPRQLKEVTVTTSKVKFYHNGDTIVYNADAFQLASGSMLDALIAQLPGAELNNDGQIKINGEFVESLLLNGKEFMDGNNNLMLENIAAYTVKDIQVYEGEKKKNVQMGINPGQKVLTMDVRLKKDYNIGWLINTQLGYGTDDRYLGKLFASWFNPRWRVTLIGNANNLNDNRQPGRNDTWTPDMMPSGKQEFRNIAMNYNYENAEQTRSAEGNVQFRQTINNNELTTYRTNFLQGGDTYETSFANNRYNQINAYTNHYFFNQFKSGFVTGASINAEYNRTKKSTESLAATFDKDPGELSAEILDAIYSNGSEESLSGIINRSKTQTDGWSRSAGIAFYPMFGYVSPGTSDYFNIRLHVDYNAQKGHDWKDYDITFGGPNPYSERLRQYYDNSPNHDLLIGGSAMYRTRIGNTMVALEYNYNFSDVVKDSYMYALDHLNDMGIYGTLPSNYLEAFDPANSYMSRLMTNNHSLRPYFQYYGNTHHGNVIIFNLNPVITFRHRHLNYWRNNIDYQLSKSNTSVNISGIWSGMIEYQFGFQSDGRQKRYRNSLRWSYSIDPELPDLVDMLDFVNDADPLNIYLGNPDLKQQYKHRHLFRWSYTPLSHTLSNIFYASYTYTNNALTRGYTYDTNTGIRYNRMYNVDGNRTYAVTNEFSWQFGKTKQFTLSSNTDMIFARYSDMIGVNAEAPQLTAVNNRTLTENIKLAWKLGRQTLNLRADFTNRHTTSTQVGFNTLNATHMNLGVSGIFTLPAGFGISTDFTCYMRRGYGVDYLDTTDPIWNMRVTYAPPRNSHWVFMLDGFDMLHRLSNINYAVTASGRTVSYTNTLPRYIMLSVQYRLNIQPKSR